MVCLRLTIKRNRWSTSIGEPLVSSVTSLRSVVSQDVALEKPSQTAQKYYLPKLTANLVNLNSTEVRELSVRLFAGLSLTSKHQQLSL